MENEKETWMEALMKGDEKLSKKLYFETHPPLSKAEKLRQYEEFMKEYNKELRFVKGEYERIKKSNLKAQKVPFILTEKMKEHDEKWQKIFEEMYGEHEQRMEFEPGDSFHPIMKITIPPLSQAINSDKIMENI